MLSRRARSAVHAVAHLARLSRGHPVPARALTTAGGLPARQFETVLQDLVRAGLLRSVRGVRGGYELARERRRITLGAVVRAVEPTMADAQDGPVAEALASARDAFLAVLDGVTLDGIGRQAEEIRPDAGDFTI